MKAPLDLCMIDGVGTLTLNRPGALNAMDAQLRMELHASVTQWATDPDVQVIVVTGAGGHFCSGGDVKGMGQMTDAQQGRQRMLDVHPLVCDLLQLEKPLIAAVEGVAFGAGLGLALTADFLIAGQSARFCCSFGRMGLVPDFATAYTLPRTVGFRQAKELVLSAREVRAAEALALGLVSEITPAGGALQRAHELAARLTRGSPTAFALSKRMLCAAFHSDLPAMLAMEADSQGIAYDSSWHRRAVQDFIAKEPARFRWPRSPGD